MELSNKLKTPHDQKKLLLEPWVFILRGTNLIFYNPLVYSIRCEASNPITQDSTLQYIIPLR